MSGRLETRKRLREPLRGLGEVDAQMQHLTCGVTRRGVLAPSAETCLPPGCKREAVLLEAGVLRMEDSVGAVLLLDFLQLVGNRVERLFPGNLHEVALAGALFTHAFHRVEEARFGLNLLLPRVTHRARRIWTLPFQMFSQPQSSRLSLAFTESSGSTAMSLLSFTWHFRMHAESQHPFAGHEV